MPGSASALQRLQRDLQRYVVQADAGAYQRIARRVVSTPRVDGRARASIYADGYRLRLLEALQTDYPALRALLGDAAFERLARGYIQAHPSRHANLRWYGGEVAGWLAQAAPHARRPVLAELARFEWAVGLAFDAADDPVLGVEQLVAFAPEQWGRLRFRLHASVQRLPLRWNAPDLWQAAAAGQPLRPRRLRRAGQPASVWAVWRRELTPRYRRLFADEAWALAALARGRSFGALCAGLTRWVPEADAPLRAATLLKTWVLDQMISTAEAP